MPAISFSNLSIRKQLILLAILLTLPALGVIVYGGLKERADDYRKAGVESQRLADHLAAEQESMVREALQLSGLLAELPDVVSRNRDKVQALIRTTISKNPQYTNILITDADGMAWVSGLPFTPPLSLKERLYFRNARSTMRFSSGEFMLGAITRKPTIALAYPMTVQGRFSGVVVICFDLDVLKSILKRSQLPNNSNYILTDHHGMIVSRGNETGRPVGESIQPEDLRRMERGPDRDTYEFVRSDGDRRITTYRKLSLPGEQTPYMYVRAGISIKSAVAKANRQLWYNVGVMIPFVLAALILAFWIGKRSIVDRVKKLRNASQRFAGGDLNWRVGDQVSGGELGELAHTFDEMAHTLESTIRELRQSQQLLREKALLLETEIGERQIIQEQLAEKQCLLEALNRTLEERISATVQELRLKDQTLIQQNRLASMGEMINNIAHQWRQPLNLIGLIVQGLPERKELSQERLDQEIDRIMTVILHMSQTIDDFRNFFRQDKEKTCFSANQAVARAVEFLTPSLNDHQIRITVTEEPDVEVFGYSNEYSQVLLNLLGNAKDVLLERNVAEPCIEIEILRVDDCSVVIISDNGGGIGEDVMPRIFDPYFTTKGKMHGTGIGLYMSKIIVEQNMGGRLTACNTGIGAALCIEVRSGQ